MVARHYRLRVEKVTLWLLGGVAELGGQPSTPRADFRVAAVGPLTSLAAGGLCYAAAVVSAGWLPSVLVAALSWLAWINLLLALFNLLPGAPLDGGRVLRALLWRHWQDRVRAEVAAARAGRGVGGALVALAIVQVLVVGNMSGLWLGLLGWVLIQAATVEQRMAELADRFGRLPVRVAMDPRPPVAHLDQSVQDFIDTVARPSRQRSFFAVDAAGRPAGVVQLARLARVAPTMRTSTAVADVLAPVGMILEADRPLIEVAAADDASAPGGDWAGGSVRCTPATGTGMMAAHREGSDE